MASSVTARNTTLFIHPATGLRRIFYLISPWETSYATIEEVPEFVNEAIPYFLLLILVEYLIAVAKDIRRARVSDSIASIGAGLLSQLPLLFGHGIEMVTYIWVFNNYCLYHLPWDSAWTWFFGFLGVDFAYYWVHRMAHEINLFWSGHQAHHSSEEYNLTTALRQSIMQKYFSWFFYLPMALFVPPSIFLVHIQFNLLYQFWIHTEVIDRLPAPLEYVLNTPSHHRVHHGRNPYCIDTNYGGTLIIFDRIFGTFCAERRNDKVVYGLVHPLESCDPVYIQLCHLQYICETALQRTGLDKLRTFFGGPGWVPGKPRLGDPADLPPVTYNPQQLFVYNPHTPLFYTLYCAFHFVLLLPIYQAILVLKDVLPFWSQLVAVAFIVLSLSSFGRLSEGRIGEGSFIEVGRCLLYTVADVTIHYLLGWKRGLFSVALLAIYGVSFMVTIFPLIVGAPLYYMNYKSKKM